MIEPLVRPILTAKVQPLNSLPPLVALRSRYGQRLDRLGYLAWIVVTGLSSIGLFLLITGGRTPVAELDRFQRTLVSVLTVAFYIPSAYLGVRRLHDFDRSGWWYVMVHLGALLLPAPYARYLTAGLGVVLLLIPGTEGENRYGVRSAVKPRADDGIPTVDGRPPFDPNGEPDEKAPRDGPQAWAHHHF